MILSDATLTRMVGGPVTPFDAGAVGPCSVDLHLGDRLLRLPYGVTLDPEADQSELWQETPLAADGRWFLGRETLYLGATLESVTVPTDMVALLHGVSSLGRLGLLVHVTAGLVDSGWAGPLTLEIVSLGGSIRLRPGQRIGQLTYHLLDGHARSPYTGRYVGDTGPTPSRAHLDVEARP